MSTDQAVTVDVADHVATVEIHRPPHNWFDLGVMTTLADSVLGLDDDAECRAVVLCSEGKNFCAGADLSGSDLIEHTDLLYEQAARLFSNRKPIVAAVQGAAVGGGLGLALAADFRVATPETRFSCNFAKLGFHQGFGISVTLPAVVGQQRAGVDVHGRRRARRRRSRHWPRRSRRPDRRSAHRRTFVRLHDRGFRSTGVALDPRDHARRPGGARARRRGANTSSNNDCAPPTTSAEGIAASSERRTPRFTGK